MRIGINSGRAIRANVGSAGRREYTFIGDAVNTAQRKEIALKGKKKTMAVYECSL